MSPRNESASQRFGSSESTCDYIVEHCLSALAPQAVVDFGAGAGKNGALIRRAVGSNCQAIAVEGFEPAASALRQQGVYDRVDLAMIQDWVDECSERYDVGIFGDVIEHLKPAEIRRAIEACQVRFDWLLIVVPLHDIFQDDSYGNSLEIHQTYVTEGFFDRYRPCQKHVVESGRYTIMVVLIPSARSAPAFSIWLAQRVFHVLMLVLQPLGLARPCVALMKRVGRRYKSVLRG